MTRARRLSIPADESVSARASAKLLVAPPRPPVRLATLDALRGVAVVAMILFHVAYDLREFAGDPLRIPKFWFHLGNLPIAGLFFGILGFSAELRRRARPGEPVAALYRRRGLTLFGLGMLLTAITAVMSPRRMIYFGVLHCLGVSLLLLPAAMRLRASLAPIGVAIVVAGLALREMTFPFRGVIWLGFRAHAGGGIDSYPLLPWLGVAMIGVAIARRTDFGRIAASAPSRGVRAFAFLGRHSLAIYLIHQPLVLGVLWLLGARIR